MILSSIRDGAGDSNRLVLPARHADPENIAIGCRFNASTLARRFGISLRSLERHFLRNLGVSPSRWLLERRMERAVWLLRRGMRVQRVVEELGFKQASHFCRAFRIYHGCTASEYLGKCMSIEENCRGSIKDFPFPTDKDVEVSTELTHDHDRNSECGHDLRAVAR